MNTFGKLFRISIFGESHGINVGVVIDGIPAGLPLTHDDLEKDLSRRRAGARGTTPRQERDIPHIVSGIFNDLTTGAPITIIFKNENTRSKDYSKLRETYRPGHSDFTANVKYGGFEDYRGGGHFSGRITLGIVAAGSGDAEAFTFCCLGHFVHHFVVFVPCQCGAFAGGADGQNAGNIIFNLKTN